MENPQRQDKNTNNTNLNGVGAREMFMLAVLFAQGAAVHPADLPIRPLHLRMHPADFPITPTQTRIGSTVIRPTRSLQTHRCAYMGSR